MSGDLRRAFLADIVANPDEDAPRLVFADWLGENGDEERAEFIRVQIARARLPEWDAAQVRLRLREKELLDRHGAAWKAEVPEIKGVRWGKFRRGFVGEAKFAGFAALRSFADACWAAAPIEAVSIGWPDADDKVEAMLPIPGLRELSLADSVSFRGEVERLAAAPLLSTLRVLKASGCELGAEGFQALLRSPHLRGLQTLHAGGNAIGNRGLEALRTARLDSLEELDLAEAAATGNEGFDNGYDNGYGQYGEDVPVIDVASIGMLAEWPGLARLRSLNLSGSTVRRDGLHALLHSPGVAGLKELRLRSAWLSGDVGRIFHDASAALSLDVLDLGGNFLEGDVYGYLGRADCLRELKVLLLDRCEMRAAETRRVAEGAFVTSLRHLDLSHDTFGPEGLAALLAQEPAFLHTLKLRNADIGDEGAMELAESPVSDVLLELNLADNHLGDKGAAALAASPHLRSLLVLRLGDNRIGERGVDALAASELGQRLAIFDIGTQEAS